MAIKASGVLDYFFPGVASGVLVPTDCFAAPDVDGNFYGGQIPSGSPVAAWAVVENGGAGAGYVEVDRIRIVLAPNLVGLTVAITNRHANAADIRVYVQVSHSIPG